MMIGTFVYLVVVMTVFGILILGFAYFIRLISGDMRLRRLSSPENTLRDRYARGEIGQQAYLDALTDILKDRYVRGELTSEEYEERLGVLLEPGSAKPRRLPPAP